MSHEVFEKMVYSYKQPMWHALAEPSMEEMPAEEILEAKFNGGFSIEMRPCVVMLNGYPTETGDLALVRSGTLKNPTSEKVMGYVSERFTPVQPWNVARMFDESVREPAETMGFLFEGSQMFITWRMPKFEVVVGDEIEMYGVVSVGLDNKRGGKLFTSTYRVVCANTLSLAEGWAAKNTNGKGKGMVYKGTKTNPNMLKELGIWMKYVQANARREAELTENFFAKLVKTPVTDTQVHEILFNAYPSPDQIGDFYPDELRGGKQEKLDKIEETHKQYRDGIYGLFAGAGTAITPDLYGVMNATTEFFGHYLPSKKPIASSVMFGNRQELVQQVVDVLKERIS